MATKNETVQVESTTREDNKIEVVVRTQDNRRSTVLKKHVAEWLDGDAISKTFVATKKEMMLFYTEHEYIAFKNNVFRTNVPKAIEYIKTHPAFNIDIFENAYPEHIKKKMEEHRRYVTRDPDEHER